MGSELYTLSIHFRLVNFRTSNPIPMNGGRWVWPVTSGEAKAEDLYSGFYLNGRKYDLLLLMQDVSSGLLLFSDVSSCLSTYTDV